MLAARLILDGTRILDRIDDDLEGKIEKTWLNLPVYASCGCRHRYDGMPERAAGRIWFGDGKEKMTGV